MSRPLTLDEHARRAWRKYNPTQPFPALAQLREWWNNRLPTKYKNP